jgi:hypothetical protein
MVLTRLTRIPANNAEDQGEHDEDDHGIREVRVRNRIDPDAVVGRGEVRDRVRAQDDERDAAVKAECADRHRQGRQADAGHQQAVEQAGDHAEHGQDDENGQHRPVLAPQETEHGAGHAEDRCHRKVDLAADDDECHRQRHDRYLARAHAHIEEVPAGQEL